VNKGAIIGIGIAIVVAGIVGIYAFSIENDANEIPKIGFEDSASIIVEEESSANPVEKEAVGFEDSATGEAEEPEKPLESVNVTVSEKFGFSDPSP